MRREDLNIVKDYNFEEGELFYRVERLNYTSEMEMSSISCVVAGTAHLIDGFSVPKMSVFFSF